MCTPRANERLPMSYGTREAITAALRRRGADIFAKGAGVDVGVAEGRGMIQLTRLNNQPLVVNSDLIKFLERAPDTVLTLISGEKVVVLESCEQVLEKVIEFRRTILSAIEVRVP